MIIEQVMTQKDIQWVRITFECSELMFEKMKTLPADTAELLFNVLKNAAKAAEGAAYTGEQQGDRGASKMVRDVEMWLHGYHKLTPREWTPLQIRLKQEKDPEFAEFQRLKKKFEGGE